MSDPETSPGNSRLGLWVAALGPSLLGLPLLWGRALLFRDILSFTLPYRVFAARGLAQGELPEWNPHLFTGMPFLADPQSALFYPLNLLLLWLPGVHGTTLLVLLHLPLAGVGAWALARALGTGERAAGLAGLGYGTCGFLLSTHDNPTFLMAAALLPGVAALLVRAAVRPCAGRVAGGTLGVGALALVGEPQTLAVACVLGLVLGAGVAPKSLHGALAALAAIAGGAFLGAIQLVPTALYARHTVRAAGLSPEEAGQIALHPVRLFELLVASPFGVPYPENGFWGAPLVNSQNRDPWVYSHFVGPVFLLPALAGGWRRRTRADHLLAGIALAATLLALGPRLPFWGWAFRWVPLFDRFRAPEKWALLLSLCLVLLSVRVLERWGETGPPRLRGAWAVAALLTLACLWVQTQPEWLEAAVVRGLATEPYATTVEAVLGRLQVTLAMSAAVTAALALVLGRLRAAGFRALWVLAMVCGLWSGWNVLSWGRSTPFVEPALVAQVRAMSPSGSAGRFVSDGSCVLGGEALGRGEGTLLERTAHHTSGIGGGNFPMLWDLRTDGGYVAAVPSRVVEVRRWVGKGPGGAYRWARLAGGTARVGCDAQGAPVVTPIPAPLPRVAVLPPRVEQPGRILELLADPAFDFSREALVSEPWVLQGLAPAQSQGKAGKAEGLAPTARVVEGLDSKAEGLAPTARVVGEGLDSLAVAVSGDGGLLVVAEAWAEGWTATVDGVPAQVVMANGLWRGVPVPPGRHQVALRYSTPGLLVGACLSLIALLTCVGACGISLVKRQRRVRRVP